MNLTTDAFLGGKLHLRQPEKGFRAGLDTVMMAACVPADAQSAVLELGAGAGIASLCLAARTGAHVTGVEIQPDMAELAAQNAIASKIDAEFAAADLTDLPPAIKQGRFDHVMANPPFQDPETGQAPPDPGKRAAHMADTPLEAWLSVACARVKDGGTVTIVHRADVLGGLLEGLSPRLGALIVWPLWPREGQPAKRVIVQGVKGSKAPLTLGPGLVLHTDDHTFTPEAAAILRQAGPLTLRARDR